MGVLRPPVALALARDEPRYFRHVRQGGWVLLTDLERHEHLCLIVTHSASSCHRLLSQ